MPTDIAVDLISDHQMAELNRLKQWLYPKRTQGGKRENELSGGRKWKRRQHGERQSSPRAFPVLVFLKYLMAR